MALNISAWSIRRPLPSIVMSIILLLLGWTSFNRLPITRLPNADIPVISVVVSQFGAAPAELEAQVTKTIEDGVSGVEGVRHIASSISDGISVTTVIFRLETNTDRALNDVKDAVTRIRAKLPRNVDEPLIQRVPNRASLRPGCAEADKLGRCANLGMFPFWPGHVRRSRS
jgi:multidrug efflux pump subunit AcrB